MAPSGRPEPQKQSDSLVLVCHDPVLAALPANEDASIAELQAKSSHQQLSSVPAAADSPSCTPTPTPPPLPPPASMAANNSIMVDWRGHALPANHRLGGLRPSLFILGVVVCGYFAFGGVFFNLVIYLRRIWNQGSATAANNSTNLVGTMYCTCILGAFLGDTYLGRILAVAIFLTIYTMGSALSAVGVTLKEKSMDNAFIERVLMGGLYVMAVGCGSYQPVMLALGGDQFSSHPAHKSRFFNWVFVASNIGVMLALTILTYIENTGRWSLGFWISTSSVGISILVFLLGIPYMQQVRLGGNAIVSILRVLVSAISKLHMKVDKESTNVPSMCKESALAMNHPNIMKTESLRWLDKATIASEKDIGKDGMPHSWRLCTRMQVEEVKCIIRIIPFIVIGVMYNVANAQVVSFFVVQGDAMKVSLSGFKVPPGSMRIFMNIAGIVFPPFYEYVIVPRLITTKNGEFKGLTPLQRMGWGLFVGAIAMATAAFLEKERLQASHKLSILWLIPQFTMMGISNSLFIVSQMDFFYSEIPQRMRSLGSSLFLLCMGLGNYGSSIVVTIVTYISSLHHHSNWLPHQIDEGHLDYFYWLLFALLLFTLLTFLIISHFYENSFGEIQDTSLLDKSSTLNENSNNS